MTAMTHDALVSAARRTTWAGLGFALLSALAFSSTGTLARGLLDSGWSAAAAVAARAWVAALCLLPIALRQLDGRWRLLLDNARLVVAFGGIAIAGTQLAYFLAVGRMEVAIALLVEFMAPIAVVAWLWMRYGVRPGRLTTIGALVCVAGLGLVLNLPGGFTLDPLGTFWALLAMLCCATYFVLSARQDTGLPPLVLTAAGMVVGALVLTFAGVIGLVPFEFSTAPAPFNGHEVPWWLPVLGLGAVAGAVAYTAGVAATRRLGSRLASFVALLEVLATLLVAWAVLGELPLPIQLLGGVLILAGVVVVKLGESSSPTLVDRG